MEDEEYKKLPIEDRCVHKLWKARVNAYEEVTKLFRQMADEKSPEFGKYLGLVKKFVVDSNVMGQEKGLEATLAYIENYAHAGKSVNEVMSGVVSKCIAAPKTRTRELALQLTLMYIEIEKYEAVEEELVKGMEQKNPKIVAACINACTVALREFGAKIINVKPLVKKITPLFADRDKSVRDEARGMVIEMYRWVGPALRPQLNNLQPVQITELEAEFAKLKSQKAVPTRYIRSQQQKQAILATEAENVDGVEAEDGEEEIEAQPQMDPYDLAEPVDVLSKLPKDFYDKIEEKKWQERKDVLEILENHLKTAIKLENGEYGELVRALKKVVQKDSNVICVASAARSIAGIANGLKKRFQTYSGNLVSTLLEKFKEKKQNVVTAIRDAVDAVYLTTNIEAISDDIVEALGNKNPSVKAETCQFLARAFTKTLPTALNKRLLKSLTTTLTKLINEPDPGVRDAAAEAIGTLMKLVGEKAIGPFLIEFEKDSLKMSKIKECCDKAVIQVKVPNVAKKERPASAPPKTTSKPTVEPQHLPKSASMSHKPAPLRKKLAEISSGTATIVKSKPTSKASKAVLEKELSDEEIEEKISKILSANIMTDIVSPNWKLRLEATEKFLSEVQVVDSKEIPAQALIKAISRKPGLKDTNFQVLKAKLDVVKYLAENSNFSSTSANVCIVEVAEKFGDPKNGNAAAETMTAIAEATNLNFVASTIVEFGFNQKNPKVQQEILLWLSSAIKEFGFANVNAKLLIDNAKKGLGSTNPAVRQASITFCGVLYLYMGTNLHMFFENEKPALRDQINAEFDKYQNEKAPTPTRGARRTVKSQSANSLDNLDTEEQVDEEPQVFQVQAQDLFPRVDISGQITESLINEIEDKNWKVRNEALTKVSQIIQEAKLIKSNLGDLPTALVHRLADSNTKIAQTALNICEAIAKSMGPAVKQYIKVFFPYFLKNLSDSKDWMRKTALDTINTYADLCGYKEFFENEMICDALKTGSPILRIELWNWLAENLPKIPAKLVPKEELVICVPYLFSNLEDRNADVRKYAQEAIYGIMLHTSFESMAKQTEKLKPGSKNVVMAALEKVRPNLPVKPLPPTKSSAVVVKGTKAVASKPTLLKPKGSSAKIVAPARSKKEEDVDLSPLLVVNNMKHQRTIDESKLKVLKWNFSTPREEFVDLLKEQMSAANINKTLMANMFHLDFRYHIKAIESLTEDLPDNGQALISNLDLILKWLTLRFFDTNPSVLLKGLEYLQLVFGMLIDAKYKMLENEASSFLPYLILKIGDPKDSVRNGVKSLFKQIYFIYPISRVFTYVMEGVKSKNARLRAESLEVMGSIIAEYGVTVCTPSAAACLKEIAKQISDRDNSVRNAALNCIVAAYNYVGDKVYKMVGNISDKDLSLLEERIKRSKKNPNPAKSPQKERVEVAFCEEPNDNVVNRANGDHVDEDDIEEDVEVEEDEEEEEDQNLPVLPTQIKLKEEPSKKNETNGPYHLDHKFLEELDNSIKKPDTKPTQEFNLDFIYEDVNMPKLSEVKAKMLHLSPPKPIDTKLSLSRLNQGRTKYNELGERIQQIVSNDLKTSIAALQYIHDILKSNKGSSMIDYEDEFISAIVKQLRLVKNKEIDNDVTRLLRNMFVAIDWFFNNKILGRHVTTPVIKEFIDELILLLVDGKLEQFPEGDHYVKIVNVHCVKIIERFDHTKVICAVVNLIHDCIRSEGLESRHTELVMKCIWRLIKIMPTWEEDIDYDSILLEIHNLLKEFPTSWWKNQTSDTPLRTIKTVLHACVKIKGGNLLQHLTKIPNRSESEMESYILKLMKSMKIEQEVPKRSSISKTIHSMLTEIFQKIGKKEETKEGLSLLYDLIQKHPEADIDPFLKESSRVFKDYIYNGLKEIEESRKSSSKTSLEKKVAETISSTTNDQINDDMDPDFWRKRLDMWKRKVPGAAE